MMKKIIIILVLMLAPSLFAQWQGASLRTDNKYRNAVNTAEYLSKGADSVFAQLSYIVNLDSLSNDTRIDSIKAILARIEVDTRIDSIKSILATLRTYLSNNYRTAVDLVSGSAASFTQMADTAVATFSVYNTSASQNLQISFDGTTYFEVMPGTGWDAKGLRNTNLIYLKGNYKIIRRF